MVYNIAHSVVSFLAKLFFRFKVINEANVPREGGVIVAANHNSYFDIPLLDAALYRKADNMAKVELFANPVIAWLFRTLGGFPIRRGTMDRAAMEEAVRRLKSGRLLVVYPEGTRSKDGELQAAKPGIGWIVAQSGAAVVPAYIDGTRPVRLFNPVTIIFGRPLNFSGRVDGAKKEKMHPKMLYDTIAREVMTQIAELRSVLSRLSQ